MQFGLKRPVAHLVLVMLAAGQWTCCELAAAVMLMSFLQAALKLVHRCGRLTFGGSWHML
jgi:hypothetical protein